MYWGFDTKNIDRSVRPQDDFYTYANGKWLRKTKIPADESRWGSFTMLRHSTEYQLKAIVEDTKEPMVRDMYRSAIDMPLRNKLGAKPLGGLRTKIKNIKTKEELLATVAYLHVLGVSGFWGCAVDQDSKDSTKYILHLWQGGLGMPDRDYYLLNKPEQKRVRDAYVTHIKKLSVLAGASPAEASKISRTVLGVETALAKAAMKKEDMRDSEKTYNKKSLAQLQKLSPVVNWKMYFAQTGAEKAKNIIVGQPEFIKAVSKIIEASPLEDLKTYLEWHLVNATSGLLSDKFVKESFHFYATVLSGVKVMKPLWRRALASTNGTLGDVLGKLYVKKHFPVQAKRSMDALVDNLFDAYAKRIKNLDWMSSTTKSKALLKLHALNRKIGYPKKWKSYKGLKILPNDYFGNALRSATHEHYRNMDKLGLPIDRGEWHMSPQTVNAYFSPNLNDIVFPAAILQWPFFDARADSAVNYAGIGSVIGHEITHGFDDQGSKFDAKGNMKSWWTATDKKRFIQKSKAFVSQANVVEIEPGVHINGQLTLGENMADMGGLAIAFDAYQHHLKKTGRKIITGLSPEERFFLGFAQMERELARPEYRKLAALTDPHAVAVWRINGPLSNFEPFYKAFGLKKGDKLYRTPSSRAQIW